MASFEKSLASGRDFGYLELSSLVAAFHRKVRFYEEREGKKADRRIMVSPFVEEDAWKLAPALDTEIYTRADDLVHS